MEYIDLEKEPEIILFKKRLSIINALRSIIKYNGLENYLEDWRSRLFKTIEERPSDIWTCPMLDFECFSLEGAYAYGQLQILWMLLVLLFGNYGTSPRYGWIEQKSQALYFIDGLLRE